MLICQYSDLMEDIEWKDLFSFCKNHFYNLSCLQFKQCTDVLSIEKCDFVYANSTSCHWLAVWRGQKSMSLWMSAHKVSPNFLMAWLVLKNILYCLHSSTIGTEEGGMQWWLLGHETIISGTWVKPYTLELHGENWIVFITNSQQVRKRQLSLIQIWHEKNPDLLSTEVKLSNPRLWWVHAAKKQGISFFKRETHWLLLGKTDQQSITVAHQAKALSANAFCPSTGCRY